MIKFDIKNRWTGSVLFTAEIECDENASASVKLGLAIRGAVSADAYLADANLARADLAGANLAGANLARADLAGANLAGANLAGAYLADANLARAKIRHGITITKAPVGVYGLAWPVLIYDHHMQIGCEFHSHDEWRGFDDQDWLRMGGKEALRLKYQQFPALILLCDQHRPENNAAPIREAV